MALSLNLPGSAFPTDGANRVSKFRSRFPEISYEKLVRYIPCSWRKTAHKSLYGGLYLTDNHIGFYCASKTCMDPESEKKVLIDSITITRVTKIRSLNIFPDSISIETMECQKYVFSQLFSRNAVYKTICELCGIRASRRGSVDPTFENGYDIESDYENDSHNTLFPASQNKNGSISSSNSSSSPPEIRVRKKYAAFSKRLNRVLSVVQEGEGSHSDNDTDATRCIVRFTPSFSRSVSYIQDGSSATMQQYTVSHNETVIGQWLIKLFSSIAVLLAISAIWGIYRLSTDYMRTVNHGDETQRTSLQEIKRASQILARLAKEGRKCLELLQLPVHANKQ